MDSDLLDFLSNIENSNTEEEVWTIWLKACKNLGFEVVNYVYAKQLMGGHVQASFLTNFNEKWLEYHQSQNMQNHDYLFKMVNDKNATPIVHDLENLAVEHLDTDIKKELWNSAAESGMQRALAIPFSDVGGNEIGGVAIGTSLMGTQDFKNTLSKKGTTLFAMAQVAHQRLKRKYMNPSRLSSVALSPRQSEIVKFLVIGLTNKEISYRLNISMPTVSFHLKAITKKLQVSTTREIVPKVLALNLVEL